MGKLYLCGRSIVLLNTLVETMSFYTTQRIHTMLKQLFEFIFKFSRGLNYQSELDRYVTSKNPQSTAEVDYWTRQFDQHMGRNWL